MTEPQRVQKIISNAGYCSRRKAEELIAEGKVTVNGKAIKLGDKADPEKDAIVIDGKPLKADSAKRYYLLNKPKGYVTTLSDPFKKKTMANLLEKNGISERVYPIGRLDENTEGLLILTNDGDFANKVMHPRYEVEKTYEAIIDVPISPQHVKALQEGVMILGRKTWPAEVKILTQDRKKLSMKIHEGRNRIIKRMLKELGYHVVALTRTKIGDIGIGDLGQGRIRALTEQERKTLTEPRKTFK